MPRTQTSFTPATAPKGKGGSKHLKTRLKEQMNLSGWQALADYVEGEGAARFLEELQQLEGRDFILCYLKMLEYFKAKPKAESLAPARTIRVGFITEEDGSPAILDENFKGVSGYRLEEEYID